MLNNNFIRYGRTHKVDISNITLQSDNTLKITVTDNNSLSFFSFNNLCINQDIILSDGINVYKFKLVAKSDNSVTVKYTNSIIDYDISKFLYLYVSNIIADANTPKIVSIENIDTYGEKYSDKIIRFKLKIKLKKPKTINVYKYIIKMYINDDIFTEILDYDNLLFSKYVNDSFNSIYFKVAGIYKHNGITKFTEYSDIIHKELYTNNNTNLNNFNL